MSNYNDFDLDIRSTQNAGSVGPQSVPLTNFTCNCTTGVVCYATNLLCTPGNICDITMGCTDGCSEGCEPGEPLGNAFLLWCRMPLMTLMTLY